jgi:hypothetical protein
MPNFQAELNRIVIQSAALELLAWAIGLVVLYFVVRSAVRDGINDSRLGDRPKIVKATPSSHNGDTLPPMHAD